VCNSSGIIILYWRPTAIIGRLIIGKGPPGSAVYKAADRAPGEVNRSPSPAPSGGAATATKTPARAEIRPRKDDERDRRRRWVPRNTLWYYFQVTIHACANRIRVFDTLYPPSIGKKYTHGCSTNENQIFRVEWDEILWPLLLFTKCRFARNVCALSVAVSWRTVAYLRGLRDFPRGLGARIGNKNNLMFS